MKVKQYHSMKNFNFNYQFLCSSIVVAHCAFLALRVNKKCSLNCARAHEASAELQLVIKQGFRLAQTLVFAKIC